MDDDDTMGLQHGDWLRCRFRIAVPSNDLPGQPSEQPTPRHDMDSINNICPMVFSWLYVVALYMVL